jgi:hypothetical protein
MLTTGIGGTGSVVPRLYGGFGRLRYKPSKRFSERYFRTRLLLLFIVYYRFKSQKQPG